jgi:glutamyl-tRNA synthetase
VFARSHTGQFIIRVEDTDRTRLVQGSEERILASLKWLGIPYAEGPDIGGPYAPYRQSDRLNLYKKYAEELVGKGHAYYCFCTTDRLADMRKDQEANHLPPMYDGLCKTLDLQESKKRVTAGEKYVIRLNVPDEGVTTFHDIIRGDVSFENKLIDDQVLLKSDGFPTYHLGVVVDDHIMKISHIIRGEEWISSTPKHILLYKFFGWELPVFAHMPLLRNPDKSKLSKRKNPVWVSDYKIQGFVPEAIKNYLATMAWAFPDGRDIFSVEEMVKEFKLENIQTTAPIFDVEKLKWMNGKYIQESDINAFYDNKYPEATVKKIWPLVRERMRVLTEFDSLAGFFFARPASFERPMKKDILAIGQKALVGSDWTHVAMEKSIRDAADAAKLKARDVFMELRIAVTGKTVGPPLLESFEILGKEEVLARLIV